MAARIHNFNPGPAALPLQVLEEVREAQASGEISNRDEAMGFVRKRIGQGD